MARRAGGSEPCRDPKYFGLPGGSLPHPLLGGGDATSVECTLDVNGLGLFTKPEKLLNERLEMLRQTLGV